WVGCVFLVLIRPKFYWNFLFPPHHQTPRDTKWGAQTKKKVFFGGPTPPEKGAKKNACKGGKKKLAHEAKKTPEKIFTHPFGGGGLEKN
ncbi:hypothetical protein DNR41_27390, partial [Escherichia coli]